MAVQIGIVGCGVMGTDHARLLHREIFDAALVAVQDVDQSRALEAAAGKANVRIHRAAEELIADPEVQAVIIASPDATHASLATACLKVGKPVLCEKPLAATLEDCRAVMAREAAGGRRLLQVAYMRRFDPGYRAMKASLDGGRLGSPLFLHCVHRNAVAPHYITSDLVIGNSSVHEIDIARFLLDEEFAAVTVVSGKPSRHASARRPQFMAFESTSGVVVTIEAFLDAQYGYDVRAELVCEDGVVSLAPNPPVSRRADRLEGFEVHDDWRARFSQAYRDQLKEWVASIKTGLPVGSSAWDGYAASATAAAALQSLATGRRTTIELGPKPALYDR